MNDQENFTKYYNRCRDCVWQCKCNLKIRNCDHFYNEAIDNCMQEIYYDDIVQENYDEYIENIEE